MVMWVLIGLSAMNAGAQQKPISAIFLYNLIIFYVRVNMYLIYFCQEVGIFFFRQRMQINMGKYINHLVWRRLTLAMT